MKNLKSYIATRKKHDLVYSKDFDKGYQNFKFGVLFKTAREEAGLTQEQLAEKLNFQQLRDLL